MEELRTEVTEVMENELARANKLFPLFNTDHEGISVIREEVGEALEEVCCVTDICKDLEEAVFKNKTIREKHSIARQGIIAAIAGACELIQTAAMFDKFRTSMDQRHNDESEMNDIPQEEFNRWVSEALFKDTKGDVIRKFLDKLDSDMESERGNR